MRLGPDTIPSTPGALARAWFELSLRAFPEPFRKRFSDSMREDFAEGCQDAGESGWTSLARYVLRTMWNMTVSGARERRSVPTPSSRSPRGRPKNNRGNTMLDAFRQDLVFAVRSLARNPLFSVAALVTLGLGVGATTSMFSLVNGVLLTPLPYQEADRLIRVFSEDIDSPGQIYVMSKPDLLDAQELPAFEAMAGYGQRSDVLTGEGNAALLLTGLVTSGLLEVFDLEPFMGRDLHLEESAPGNPNVVVVGYSFWMTQLGADPAVLGRTLEIEGEPFEIVGVAPPGFDFPNRSQLWRPFVLDPQDCGRSCHAYNALARLTASGTLELAREQTEALGTRLAEEYPESNGTKGFSVMTLQERTVGAVKAELWILLGAVGLVLLVACANVANLLLARAQSRVTEVGIRAAMGAGRRRLLAQILTESLVLATMGGILGLGLAFGGVALLKGLSPGNIPRMEEVGVDPPVLLFTLVLTLGVALVFGLSPALGLTRSSPVGALSRSGRGSSAGRPSHKTRSVLLATEMALSVVLLVGAGLLLRTLGRMHDIQPGYRVEDVLRFSLTLPDALYSELEQVTQFFQELEERVGAIPQVASVGSVFRAPLGGGGSNGHVAVEGRPDVPGQERRQAYPRPMTSDYLRTMGIPVIQGRGLLASDDGEALPVALVNQTFVDQNFPGEDPIGKRFRVMVTLGFQSPTWTIVGVVPDTRSLSLAEAPVPEVFAPLSQMGTRSMTMVVRSAPGAPPLLPAIRAEVQAMDADLPLRAVGTMEQAVSAEMAPTRFYLILLMAFAGLAVVLAAVGLYGVVSYLVSLRRQEVGIRMALGADAGGVLRMFFRQASTPTLAGMLVGLGIALASGRTLEGFLYEVNPRDPLVFGAVAAVLVCVALVATALPARAATRISPTEAMRVE